MAFREDIWIGEKLKKKYKGLWTNNHPSLLRVYLDWILATKSFFEVKLQNNFTF